MREGARKWKGPVAYESNVPECTVESERQELDKRTSSGGVESSDLAEISVVLYCKVDILSAPRVYQTVEFAHQPHVNVDLIVDGW